MVAPPAYHVEQRLDGLAKSERRADASLRHSVVREDRTERDRAALVTLRELDMCETCYEEQSRSVPNTRLHRTCMEHGHGWGAA